MKRRYLTILIIPHDSSGIRQLKIPARLIRFFTAFLVVFILGISFIVYDYGNMRLQVTTLNDLKKENTAQKIELQNFSAKIKDLESQVARLKLFDKKLRIIANLEKPGQSDDVLGMGGASLDEVDPLSLDSKREQLVHKMRLNLEQLKTEVEEQEKSFAELHGYLLKQSSLLASTPSIWPTRGWVTSRYGKRISPFTGLPQMHRGIDIANRVGTPIIAPGDGVVIKVSRDRYLGKMLIIDHGYGIRTTYGHLSEIFVKVGQKVKRGDKIAAMGNTGRSTGPHLHYEVAVNGVSVNPTRYILN